MKKFLLLALALFLASVSAVAQSNTNNVTLTWTDSVTSGVTGYNVYRAAAACSTNPTLTKIGSAGATATTFTDSNVADGNVYCYGVTAVGANGIESTVSSAEVSVNLVPPAPPTNLTATVH